VNKSLSRAIAITAVCAAGLSGALATSPTAVAGKSRPAAAAKIVKTNFAYKADVFGAKVLLDGVELRSLKTSYSQQRCTTLAGVLQDANTIGSVEIPESDLVKIGGLTSDTQTFRNVKKGINGIVGTATVADVELGGMFQGVQTPTVVIKGLTSKAVAYYDKSLNNGQGGFATQESFGAPTITFGNLDTISPELQAVFDELGGLTGPLTQAVLDVISGVTGATDGLVEIEGLGSISLLGTGKSRVKRNSAESLASILRLEVDVTGNSTRLELGRAYARIARPVPAGVFRSTATALRMRALNDSLELGTLGQVSVPCEGTRGVMKRKSFADTSVLGGLVSLTGIRYGVKGEQFKNGRAESTVISNVASVEVPSVGLVVDGLRSTVILSKPAFSAKQQQVTKKFRVTIGNLAIDGEKIDVDSLVPGEDYEFGDGNILRYKRVVKNNYRGAELHGLQLVLGSPDQTISLGWVAGSIYRS